MAFFRTFLEDARADVMDFLSDFFESGILSKELGAIIFYCLDPLEGRCLTKVVFKKLLLKSCWMTLTGVA